MEPNEYSDPDLFWMRRAGGNTTWDFISEKDGIILKKAINETRIAFVRCSFERIIYTESVQDCVRSPLTERERYIDVLRRHEEVQDELRSLRVKMLKRDVKIQRMEEVIARESELVNRLSKPRFRNRMP
ncbi:hypothetical protein U1Q18_050294 [Sarracenia purpurea var. burkii]